MDPRTDRKNGNIFLWAQLLIYLCAPVRYIGVIQTALCDKLGASAKLANLPTSLYFFAGFAPIIASCYIPRRWERGTIVVTGVIVCAAQAVMATILLLPLGGLFKIYSVAVQSLVLGLLNTVQQLYLLQCMGRATSEAGRARALKLGFAFGPIAAVAGNLLAQWVLGGGVRRLWFPRDFAFLYLVGIPCSGLMAWFCSRMEMEPLPDEPRPRLWDHVAGSFAAFLRDRTLIALWVAYFFWYASFQALSNVSLYARHAMGTEPASVAGLITAVQFGAKAVAGYAFGVVYGRYGVRAPLIASIVAMVLAMLWAWNVPGYLYLAAFAFGGAGQLGGIYFPNVLLSWKKADAPRYLAVLTLAGMAASVAPVAHGYITDHWGFPPSFMLAIGTALAGLVIVLFIPAPERVARAQ